MPWMSGQYGDGSEELGRAGRRTIPITLGAETIARNRELRLLGRQKMRVADVQWENLAAARFDLVHLLRQPREHAGADTMFGAGGNSRTGHEAMVPDMAYGAR